MGKVLIIISGSDEKSTTQETDFRQQTLLDQFSPSIKEDFVFLRKHIKNLIQEKQVYDFKIKDENRIERESNRLIVDGPDFGGDEIRPVYLPAFKRYHGRFFNQLKREDWEKASENGYHVFILTPLYGFVGPMDTVQNYNCYFTDSIIESVEVQEFPKIMLSDIWSETLTDSLFNFTKTHKIQLMIDLLNDEMSQKLINWEKLDNTGVLHRLFKEKTGQAILPNLRKFLINDILSIKSETALETLKSRYPIEKDYFKGDVLIFESTIGEITKGFAREKLKYDKKLSRNFPVYWERFSKIEKDALRLSEELFDKFKDSNNKRQLMTAIIQEYWGVLEFSRKCFLDSLVDIFKREYPEIEEEIIILIPQRKNISLSKLIEDIEKKDCIYLQAYATQLLLESSLHAYYSASKFLKFISDKLGRGFIHNFVENYDILRPMRNIYKCINSRKQMNEIKSDLDKFRSILFNEEKSPLVLFEKFEERLRGEQY